MIEDVRGKRLTAVADQMDALLSYANDTTGEADTRLGDAVKTLCDGYGQGGGGTPDFETVFVIENDITGNTNNFAVIETDVFDNLPISDVSNSFPVDSPPKFATIIFEKVDALQPNDVKVFCKNTLSASCYAFANNRYIRAICCTGLSLRPSDNRLETWSSNGNVGVYIATITRTTLTIGIIVNAYVAKVTAGSYRLKIYIR